MPDDDELRERLNALLGGGDQPMVVVTTRGADATIAGCLVGFASQCSINPPLFAAWLSVRNHTFTIARTGRHLAVHVLAPAAVGLAELFGSVSGHERDKFAECAWSPGPYDLPILGDAAGWFAGPAQRHSTSGDHALFVVTAAIVAGSLEGRPLSFQDVKHIEAGNPA